MFNDAIGFRPRQVAAPRSLKGYSGNANTPPLPAGIPHGTEVVIGSVQCPRIGYAVLEDLYFDGDAAGAGLLHFRVTVNGQTLPLDIADSYVSVGSSTARAKIGENIPAGALVEIRCKNESPADDTLKAFCDGTVAFYERSI